MSRLLKGDVRDILPTLEDQSVQMCVTSPPYWGLRDYGVEGQLGLEKTPEEYVGRMVEVFREVRRVLRDDGTAWINLGVNYARDIKKGQHKPGDSGKQDYIIRQGNGRAASGFSFDGTPASEHLAEASVQPPPTWPASQDSEHPTACTSGISPMSPPLVVRTQGRQSFFSACGRSDCKGVGRCGLCWCSLAIPSLHIKPKDEINIPHLVAMALQADGWCLRQTIVWHKPNPMPESVTDRCTKAHEYIFLLSKRARYYFDAEAIKGPVSPKTLTINTTPTKGSGVESTGEKLNAWMANNGGRYHPEKVNKRSVWTVNSQPYAEAHFATFPPKLIEPCILAGSRPGDTVLDPFFGSGTVGEVCERLGRKWVGIEINPEYVAMAQKRTAQRGLGI